MADAAARQLQYEYKAVSVSLIVLCNFEYITQDCLTLATHFYSTPWFNFPLNLLKSFKTNWFQKKNSGKLNYATLFSRIQILYSKLMYVW